MVHGIWRHNRLSFCTRWPFWCVFSTLNEGNSLHPHTHTRSQHSPHITKCFYMTVKRCAQDRWCELDTYTLKRRSKQRAKEKILREMESHNIILRNMVIFVQAATAAAAVNYIFCSGSYVFSSSFLHFRSVQCVCVLCQTMLISLCERPHLMLLPLHELPTVCDVNGGAIERETMQLSIYENLWQTSDDIPRYILFYFYDHRNEWTKWQEIPRRCTLSGEK